MSEQPWRKVGRISETKSKWVTIYADNLIDSKGNRLEYWHYDRADSAVIIARQGGQYLLPEPEYRPGVGKVTLDFVGGRIGDSEKPAQAAARLLEKELGVNAMASGIKPVNANPLLVDSSFSSQKVYGFVIDLPADAPAKGAHFTVDQLLTQLECMQCRAILLELLRVST